MDMKDVVILHSKCNDTSGCTTSLTHSKRGYKPLVTLWKNITNPKQLTRAISILEILLGI